MHAHQGFISKILTESKKKYYYDICGSQCFDDTVSHELAGMIRVQHCSPVLLTWRPAIDSFFKIYIYIYYEKKKLKKKVNLRFRAPRFINGNALKTFVLESFFTLSYFSF